MHGSPWNVLVICRLLKGVTTTPLIDWERFLFYVTKKIFHIFLQKWTPFFKTHVQTQFIFKKNVSFFLLSFSSFDRIALRCWRNFNQKVDFNVTNFRIRISKSLIRYFLIKVLCFSIIWDICGLSDRVLHPVRQEKMKRNA